MQAYLDRKDVLLAGRVLVSIAETLWRTHNHVNS